MHSTEVTDLIPHRPPFLWVDRIISCDENEIVTEKHIPADLDVFNGHYPGQPIMPGVLLCESVFQSGALLMSRSLQDADESAQIPVLTRIQSAKFKRMVPPDSTIQIRVKLQETLSSVSYFKGSVRLNNKIVVQVEFSCALVEKLD